MRWQWKHNTCLLFHQQCKMLASYCHCWIPLTLFSLCEKIVKWRQSAKTAKQIFKMPKRKQVIKFLTNHYKVSGLMPPKTLYSIIIGLDIDVHVHLHVLSVDFTRIDEIWKFDFERFRKSFLCDVPASLGSIYMLWWNWLWDSIPLVSTKAITKEKCSTYSIKFIWCSQSWQTFFWTIHVYPWNIQVDIENKSLWLGEIWVSLEVMLALCPRSSQHGVHWRIPLAPNSPRMENNPL